MKTTTLAYAALFCAAMVASYLTWTRDAEPVSEDGGIVLIEAKPDEIAKVHYTSKDVDVTFEHRSDDLGNYLWVTATRSVKKAKMPNPHDPHGHEAPEEEPAAAEEKTTTSFKAGTAGDQLLADLAPFRVVRRLDVGEDKLADFGFDEPSGTLAVTTKSGTERKFDVGDTAYGHKHVYLRDAASKEVFVIKRSIVSPLDRADSNLPEKELFPGTVSDVKSAAIAAPSGSLNLVQRFRDDAAKATWTAPDDETPNTTADAWLDKVFRLRSNGYVEPGKEPQAELVFAVKLELEDSKPVKIEVLRGADEKGEEAWYARSEYTRGLVTLNAPIAADAAADLATLFTTE